MRFPPGSSDDGERKGSLKRKGRTAESLPPFLILKSESGTVDDAIWKKFNFFCRIEGREESSDPGTKKDTGSAIRPFFSCQDQFWPLMHGQEGEGSLR